MSGEVNNYIGALKAKASTVKEVTLATSDRRQILVDQQHKCAICKKELNPYYSKYVQEPGSKKGQVICSNCAIPISKR